MRTYKLRERGVNIWPCPETNRIGPTPDRSAPPAARRTASRCCVDIIVISTLFWNCCFDFDIQIGVLFCFIAVMWFVDVVESEIALIDMRFDQGCVDVLINILWWG